MSAESSLSTSVQAVKKPGRRNGRRSFTILPAAILAWSGGRPPVSETEALLAVGWICRQLRKWETGDGVFDKMRVGSGRGSRGFPSLRMGDSSVFSHLRGLIVRLAAPKENSDFVAFARKMLGYKSLERALLIPVRKPADEIFSWLGDLHGCRLQKSPNQYHAKAVWLHGGVMSLNQKGTGWQICITYSYRHEDSSWGIGIEQLPGEKIEAFDARAWAWLRDQISWRHEERFYHGFFASADGMKKNELRSCADTERKMYALKESLVSVFSNCSGPGYWENDVAEPLVVDASEQFRELKKIRMSDARFNSLRRWIREDRREDMADKKERNV